MIDIHSHIWEDSHWSEVAKGLVEGDKGQVAIKAVPSAELGDFVRLVGTHDGAVDTPSSMRELERAVVPIEALPGLGVIDLGTMAFKVGCWSGAVSHWVAPWKEAPYMATLPSHHG